MSKFNSHNDNRKYNESLRRAQALLLRKKEADKEKAAKKADALFLTMLLYAQRIDALFRRFDDIERRIQNVFNQIDTRMDELDSLLLSAPEAAKAQILAEQALLLAERHTFENLQQSLEPIRAARHDAKETLAPEALDAFEALLEQAEQRLSDFSLDSIQNHLPESQSTIATHMEKTPLNAPSICVHFGAVRQDHTACQPTKGNTLPDLDILGR